MQQVTLASAPQTATKTTTQQTVQQPREQRDVDDTQAADAMFDELTRRLLPLKQKKDSSAEFTCALYECGKCKRRQSRFVERQDRALDEGASTYVTCICGHGWRIRG